MKYGLSPVVETDLNKVDVSQYACLKALNTQVAKTYKVQKNELEFFNSTESLIDSFFMNVVFKQTIENCYIYSPSFKKYAQSANTFCKSVKHINRFEHLDFNISSNSVVIFTNPSKPDGKYYDLKTLFEFWKGKNASIFIDEAFLDFSNEASFSSFINDYDKLYVLKSMQRFYNIDGINIATLISHKNNIEQIKKHEAKYKLSSLDTQYLLDVFKDKHFKKINQAVNVKNMMLLEEVLKCTKLFEIIYPSNTNMLLCKLKTMEAKAFLKLFKNEKLNIKECQNFKFLDKFHVRFTLKSEEEIKRLVKVFQKVYA